MHFWHTIKSKPGHVTGQFHLLQLVARHAIWQFRKRMGCYPKTISFGLSKLIIRNRVVADACGSLINLFGKYDGNLHLAEIFNEYSKSCVLYDVGANVGVYAVAVSENTDWIVISFEAHPETAIYLQENVNANERKNVSVVNRAVSDKEDIIYLSNTAASPINKIEHGPSSSAIEVHSISLDRFAEMQQHKPIGLKIDVEGHEPAVLRGAKQLLADSVEFVFIEENVPDEVAAILHSYEFQGPYYYHVGKKKLMTSVRGEDAVYVKNNLLNWLKSRNIME
jgi:FkbM family methyltransferase